MPTDARRSPWARAAVARAVVAAASITAAAVTGVLPSVAGPRTATELARGKLPVAAPGMRDPNFSEIRNRPVIGYSARYREDVVVLEREVQCR